MKSEFQATIGIIIVLGSAIAATSKLVSLVQTWFSSHPFINPADIYIAVIGLVTILCFGIYFKGIIGSMQKSFNDKLQDSEKKIGKRIDKMHATIMEETHGMMSNHMEKIALMITSTNDSIKSVKSSVDVMYARMIEKN